jgi:hypothetical protein
MSENNIDTPPRLIPKEFPDMPTPRGILSK